MDPTPKLLEIFEKSADGELLRTEYYSADESIQEYYNQLASIPVETLRLVLKYAVETYSNEVQAIRQRQQAEADGRKEVHTNT